MTAVSSSHVMTGRKHAIAWAGLAIVLTALNLRTAVTGFTPLLEIIGTDLGFSVTLAGLLGTVPAVSFAVFGFLAPAVTRRFGLERTAMVALALTALSLALRAFSPDALILVLSTILALAGIGAANVVIVPLVKAWFPDRLALWTSLYLILMQTGQFTAPLVAVPVADAVSWQVSVGIWAVPAAFAAVVWLVVAVRMPEARRRRESAQGSGTKPRIAGSPTTWGLVVLFAMISLSNYCIITWVPAVLTDAGGDAALGGVMVAVYSAWGVVAAFVVPHIGMRLANPFAIVITCAIFLVVGYAGLLIAPLEGALAWVCALGVGVSAFPLCMTLINIRTRTPQTASAVSGFVQGIGYALASIGPIGLGIIREATDSWTVPLVVLAASAIPGVFAGWFACRPRYVEDAAEE